MPGNTPSHRWWHIADRIGATASFLCAVHCAVLPFVLALLPLLGLEFLAGHVFERVFVLCAAALASVVLVAGYRRHLRRLPLMLAAPGLLLLVAGVCVDLDKALLEHAVMVTTGGTLLACAHLVNLRFSRTWRHACKSLHPHERPA
ncbi:MAG TPA: MerC domain-containing protein [Oleiagrimonas sp.]|nr:MerC domain-containing protein [Oleiagrimonas sp.]